jgi:hypothetical protein
MISNEAKLRAVLIILPQKSSEKPTKKFKTAEKSFYFNQIK